MDISINDGSAMHRREKGEMESWRMPSGFLLHIRQCGSALPSGIKHVFG